MKRQCVIFDLDGTLADTTADIASAMNRALALNRLSVLPETAYPPLVGWGMRRLALNALNALNVAAAPDSPETAKIVEKLTLDAIHFYAKEPLVKTKPYPGIPELLSALSQKKITMAILTNKPDPIAQIVVNGLFPGHPFALVQGEITGIPRKPDPAAVWDILAELDKTPGETLFAGDSEIDMQTARASGCFPLAVSWGFRPRHDLEKSSAAKIIDAPADLLALLE